MLFVFYHHSTGALLGSVDLYAFFNPFAELFVGIAGFMVGMIYMRRKDHSALTRRAWKILLTYFALAIPVSIGAAYLGVEKSSPWTAIVEVLTFQQDRTGMGILRFYGLMFFSLPLLLPIYKVHPRKFLFLSVVTFLVTTHLFQSTLFESNSFFVNSIIFVPLQWQLFFFIGMAFGENFWQGGVNKVHLLCGAASLITFGLILDWTTGFTVGPKFPYSFDKYITLLWTLPLTLVVLYKTYQLIRHMPWCKYILNVGKNSLVAFIAAEVVYESIKLGGIVFHVSHATVFEQQAIGLLAAILTTTLLWQYELRRRQRSNPLHGL